MVFGKPGIMHRSIGFFSNTSEGYRYSNQIARSQPLTEELDALMNKVNEDLNTNFNGILVNYYENGKETIGAHSDDEKGLGRGSIVAGISLGATRIMRFRPKKLQKQLEEAASSISLPPNNTRIDVELPDNSLIVMEGDFQKEYTHEVPSQAKILQPRISLTFRHHLV
jgi:alkylated DNA repair dioxygenase AlkB